MAGFYPDAPNHRFAYDEDGSVGFYVNGSVFSISSANLAIINSDPPTNTSVQINVLPTSGTYFWGLIFPELRDVTHIALATANFSNSVCSVSTDTTNGQDGTWSDVATITAASAAATSTIRRLTNPGQAISGATGIKAIRFATPTSGNRMIYIMHMYGAISSSAAGLRLWHPTLDEPLGPAALDWGDVYRGQTITPKQFRIKNEHGSLTANTVTVSLQALTDDGTQTTVQGHTLSDDDSSYSSTEVVSSIAPGAISSILYLKYAPTSSANTGIRWARLRSTVSSWS